MKFAILSCIYLQLVISIHAAGYVYERPALTFSVADVYRQQEAESVVPTPTNIQRPTQKLVYDNTAVFEANNKDLVSVQDNQEAAAEIEAELQNQAATVLHAAAAIASEPQTKDFAQNNEAPAEYQDISSNFQHYELGSLQKARPRDSVKRLRFKGASQQKAAVPCGEDPKTINDERSKKRPNHRRLTEYTEKLTDPTHFEPQAEDLQKLVDLLESQADAHEKD